MGCLVGGRKLGCWLSTHGLRDYGLHIQVACEPRFLDVVARARRPISRERLRLKPGVPDRLGVFRDRAVGREPAHAGDVARAGGGPRVGIAP